MAGRLSHPAARHGGELVKESRGVREGTWVDEDEHGRRNVAWLTGRSLLNVLLSENGVLSIFLRLSVKVFLFDWTARPFASESELGESVPDYSCPPKKTSLLVFTHD